MRSKLLSVNLFRVKDWAARDCELAFSGNFSKEAGSMARVTRRHANLLHFDEETISITVNPELLYLLNISGTFAFEPILLPRSTPEYALLQFQRSANGFLVHVGHHQDGAVLGILNHSRDQTVGIEFQ